MSDLISRQAAIDSLTNEYKAVGILGEQWAVSQCIDAIEKLPSEQPEDKCGECDAWNQYKNYPRKHGKWIPINERAAKCSLCGEWEYTNGRDKTGTAIIHRAIKHYCPNCGAKMDD